MSIYDTIAQGTAPIDYSNTLARIAALRQRDTALAQDQQQIDQRNALMQAAQDKQAQAEQVAAQRETAWDSSLSEVQRIYSDPSLTPEQKLQAARPALMAAYQNDDHNMTDNVLQVWGIDLQPKQPGQLYQTSEGFLPADKAVGKMPYQAPQRAPLEGPQRPQLVDVPQPDGTVQKQWLYPGQTSGVAVGAPAKPESAKPPAEMDKKVGTLFGSMVTAANNLAGLSDTDTSSIYNATLDSNPITRPATSAEYRKYQSAAKQWSANLLYIKSGATATPEEVQSTYLQFFPQPGDTPDVKAQKAAAREQEMRNIQSVYPDTTRQYKWKPQTTGAATKARPKVGEVRQGYIFIGGDPAKRENWAKANE